MPLPPLDLAALTDPGRVRPANEDAAGAFQHPSLPASLLIVADGVGGLKDGAYASQLAVDYARNAFEDANGDLVAAVEQGLLDSHQHLWERAAGDDTRLSGTTVVAVLLREDRTVVLHAGDSRAYHYHEGELVRVTRDHSWVAEQVEAGLMSDEDAERSPQRNIITRCLGVEPDVELERRELPVIGAGDVFLLSTDGLHGSVSAGEIRSLLRRNGSAEQLGQDLIERANSAGGPDNIGLAIAKPIAR